MVRNRSSAPRAAGSTRQITDLSGDSQLVKVLVAHGAVLLVMVIEDNGHAGLGDACLPLLVDQLLQAVCPHLWGEIASCAYCLLLWWATGAPSVIGVPAAWAPRSPPP